jgi:Na+/H+ antiporter NhaC
MTGALVPFAVLFVGIIWLGLAGAPDERGFWPILLLGLVLGMGLARDRTRYAETIIQGMSQPLVALMIMAWILAGILGAVMNASGFIDALVWLSEAIGVTGGGYAIAAFLICCLVSTSTGTSLGRRQDWGCGQVQDALRASGCCRCDDLVRGLGFRGLGGFDGLRGQWLCR